VSHPPRVVVASRGLYPPSSLQKAAAAFASLCEIQLEELGPDLSVTITPRDDAPPATSEEFLNYALCSAIESHLDQSV
jgi:hypothetical protein